VLLQDNQAWRSQTRKALDESSRRDNCDLVAGAVKRGNRKSRRRLLERRGGGEGFQWLLTKKKGEKEGSDSNL